MGGSGFLEWGCGVGCRDLAGRGDAWAKGARDWGMSEETGVSWEWPCFCFDRFSKTLSPCPAAERPHWRRQPLARYLFDSGLRDFLATEAAALAGSK